MSYEFTLPWPPTVNHWHAPARGRIVKSKKAKDYVNSIPASMIDQGLYNKMLSSKLAVHMTLNPPTKAVYDIDNRTKGVFDGLTKAKFWVDDDQVFELKIIKGETIKGGNVVLKVEVIEEEL